MVVYVQDSEEENLQDTEMDEGDEANAAVVEDGESTDAESDNSNDDLNVHQFLAELEAEFDKLQAQADLDHTDCVDFALPEEGVETLHDEDFEETLGTLAKDGGASDEEMEEREPSDAEAVPPPPPPADMTRRRLRGKQRPPVPYQNAPTLAPARKRHGLLKQPSRKTMRPARATRREVADLILNGQGKQRVCSHHVASRPASSAALIGFGKPMRL